MRYIRSKDGSSEVYPAPFAVKLFDNKKDIVDPRNQTILVYYLEQDNFKAKQYTFQDKIKVNIYEDLWIDFGGLNL